MIIAKKYAVEPWLDMMNLLFSTGHTEKYGIFLLHQKYTTKGKEKGQKQKSHAKRNTWAKCSVLVCDIAK